MENVILPNATVQQSLFVSPSTGSILTTGVSFCLGSHTFTVPEITPRILFLLWIRRYYNTGKKTPQMCSHHLCFQWLSQVHLHPPPAHQHHLYNSLFLCGPSQCKPVFQASPDSCGKTALTAQSQSLFPFRWLSYFYSISCELGQERYRGCKARNVKYHKLRFPSKSPVAMCLCWREVAPNVPHFRGLGFSTWNTRRKVLLCFLVDKLDTDLTWVF